MRIIKHSETAAYLVSASEFEELIEKLEELIDIVEGNRVLEEIQQNLNLVVDAEGAFKVLVLVVKLLAEMSEHTQKLKPL